MLAKISLLICLALTVSAQTRPVQGFAQDTEDFLIGIFKGLQPNVDATSQCVKSGNDTLQFVYESADEAVQCITFNFTACSTLFTNFDQFPLHLSDMYSDCKVAELEDKFKELETAAGWSSLGFRFFLNESKLSQLIQAIPGYLQVGQYENIGINIGWAFRLVMGFTLN